MSNNCELIHEFSPFWFPEAINYDKNNLYNNLRKHAHFLPHTVCDLSFGFGSYFHFHLDTIPRIFSCEANERDTGRKTMYLIPLRRLSAWQIDLLEAMSINKSQIIDSDQFKDVPIRCHELISTRSHRCAPKLTARFDALSPIHVKLIKGRIAKNIKYSSMEFPNKILISRSDAKSRRIINEEHLEKYLNNYGFTKVVLSKLRFDHQVLLFKHAKAIVSPHGAGLTNLIYAEDAKLLECHAEGHNIRPDFFQIAGINNCKYFLDSSNHVNKNNDMEINLSVIEKFLDALQS